jgi:hypothetical protein
VDCNKWPERLAHLENRLLGLVVALLFYDSAVVVIFLFARLGAGLSGIGLGPAVVLHSGLWGLVRPLPQKSQRGRRMTSMIELVVVATY